MRASNWAAPSPQEVQWRLSAGALGELREFNEAVQEREREAALAVAVEPPLRSEVLRVVTLETFTFDTNANSTTTIPLTDVVACEDWSKCVLQVRVHASTPFPGGASLTFRVLRAAIDPNDPSVILTGSTAVSVVIPDETAPTLVVKAATQPLSDAFRVVMIWGLKSTVGAVTITLGVDMVLRA